MSEGAGEWVDVERMKRIARIILAEVLSVGSAATAGPTVSATEEADLLDAIELRLRSLTQPAADEPDEAVARRFRAAHPDLYGREARQPQGRGAPQPERDGSHPRSDGGAKG
jgi:hypothetical protein